MKIIWIMKKLRRLQKINKDIEEVWHEQKSTAASMYWMWQYV